MPAFVSNSIPATSLNISSSPANDQAYDDWDFYTTYRDDTMRWREERDKMVKFAMGSQWSDLEGRNYDEREQLDVAMNMIRPLLRTTVSLQLAGKPQGVIYGQNIGSLAALFQKFLEWHWQKSNGTYVSEKVVMRQNREGVGFYMLFLDPTLDYGRGELHVGHLSYNNVYVDRGSGNNWDWSDAPRIMVSKLQRPEDFYRSNPSVRRDESLNVDNDEIWWDGKAFERNEQVVGKPKNISNSSALLFDNPSDGKYIRPLDVYQKVLVDVPVVRQKVTGKIMKIVSDNNPVTDEDKLFMVGDASRLNPKLLQQLGLPIQFAPFFVLEEAEVPIWRIKYHRSVSGRLLVQGSQSVLPISNYPVVPVVNEDTDNVEPRGEVDFQYGSQKLLNASMSLVLLNAAGSSNKKTAIDSTRAGRSQDFDDMRTEWSLPNAFIDMQIDPTTGKFPIQEFGPDTLNPAFFTLVQFFAQDLQFATSTHSLRSGDPSDAPETFSALQTLGRWADDTLRIRRTRHELALERVNNLILEWSPYHYNFHKFFDVTNEETNIRETFQINAPFFNEFTKAWELMNDITAMQAHYKIRMGSTAESENISESNLLMQLVNINPALAKHIIKRLPLFRPHEKEEILQDLDTVAQSQQQVQQMTEAINVMRGEMLRQKQNIDAQAKKIELQNFQLQLEKSKSKVNQGA